MKYPEEDIAADLHRELTRRVATPHTFISIQGEGVHWHCTVSLGNSVCRTACFSVGPEYYTEFKRESVTLAISRSPSRDHTIAAISDWLDGMDLAALHARYPFVDKTKRALSRLLDSVLAIAPVLQRSAKCDLKHQGGDFFKLCFMAGDRACVISFYGKNSLPDAKFSWDRCQLFEFQPDDDTQLASILVQWVCNQAPPSALRAEFPWLHIGELADYYERGNPIEGEFIQSWDGIESFYRRNWGKLSDDVLDLVLEMIRHMRVAGFDRVIRAGQSMLSFGLSRSRRHGLTVDQPSIWFAFRPPVMNVHAKFAGARLENHPIKLTNEVRALMDALVDCEVD